MPALHLDGAALAGTPQQLLNENVAVLTYLGDAAGANTAVRLCPPEGSPLRYALLNRLGFLASELHKAFGPVFGPLNAAAKQRQKEVRGQWWRRRREWRRGCGVGRREGARGGRRCGLRELGSQP